MQDDHVNRSELLNPPTYIRILIEFLEPLLGTIPKDPELFARWIAEKIRKRKDLSEEEKEALIKAETATALEELKKEEKKGYTGFHQDEQGYWTYNYWIRGFMKTAITTVMETGDIAKIKNHKSRIDRFIHVSPRKLHFIRAEGDAAENETEWALEVLQRPLRAMTRDGPRVSIARSDILPSGTKMEFTIELLNTPHIKPNDLRLALEYGLYEGMGQWRSGGYGIFRVLEFDVTKQPKRNKPRQPKKDEKKSA
ncbi:MAG: hypothetical protein GY847_01720 [Proteobacteria bacterium]|nr:hypothetical protein [Pseudomonadota bacterium]